MAQIQSGNLTPFTSGQVLTAADLNSHVNSATLLPGAITDVTNITANTVASGDSILLYDLSATALREANISDVLGSNLPVTTSVITTSAVTAGANSDILITPNDGVIVTGQAYTSGDGLTVTVTSTAHLLTVGQVILVTAAGTGYNGTFRVATVLTNSFTYVMTTAATAGSGTLSYTKKGLVKNPANKSIAGNLYVDGSTAVAGSEYVAGSLTVAGATTLSGATTASGSFTSSGTANFTGVLQVNGTVGYVLTEISEETMTPYIATTPGYFSAIWTSTAFVKPSEEIWVFETVSAHSGIRGWSYDFAFRYGSQTAQSGQYLALHAYYDIGNSGVKTAEVTTDRWVVNAGTAIASDTVKVDVYAGSGSQMTLFETAIATSNITSTFGGTLAASKFRIYKYKTA